MTFYIRKAIAVGPFRFNLSKSGLGVSVGVKGLRLGAGPRGNYVHMGRGGLYYRATLPPAREQRPPAPAFQQTIPEPAVPDGSVGPMVEIESAAADKIVDSSSRELLQELHTKRRAGQVWPAAAIGFAVLTLFAWAGKWPLWVAVAIPIVGVALTVLAYLRDVQNKTVVVFYDLEPDLERAFEALHEAGAALAGSAATWHVEASGKVHDRKYHAGASDLVNRKRNRISSVEPPPYVKTNVPTISMAVGRQTLHFFPDRVLIYEPGGVGAVGYKQLSARAGGTRFIESGGVPSDAEVVDRTWRYVNKSGGPDRRFKDNKELPVCLYDELALTSATGLNELVQVSRTGVAAQFANALAALASMIPDEPRAAVAQ
jgi:hypothetical protein